MADLHVWEKCGLGKAPFRFVGFYESKYQACPGAPIQPGTCCDYCGTALMLVCQIQDATGHKFKVGSDCVRKVGEAGITKALKASPEHRKYQRDQRHAREAEKVKTLTAQWEALHDAIATRPHPNKYFADQGKTFLDYQKFILAGCGTSGTIRNLKHIVSKDWN